MQAEGTFSRTRFVKVGAAMFAGALILFALFLCDEEAAAGSGPPAGPAAAESFSGVEAPPEDLVKRLGLDPFYKKHLTAKGLPVLASEKVSDFALVEAVHLINRMLGERDDIRKAMIDGKVRCVIMAWCEYTTCVPEHSGLEPGKFWDRRARGLGATPHCPVVSCGEENLLCYPGDPYREENILIHEFAHTIHHMGLNAIDPEFDGKLKRLHDSAVEKRLWKGTYAISNRAEYWAEGVQSWFGTNRENDNQHNHVNTREELKEYDPGLFQLIADQFGDGEWQYVRPLERKESVFPVPYDPGSAPTFAWPPELLEWYKNYQRQLDDEDKDLKRLVGWMAGSFSSEKQSREDPAFFDIRLEMARIWPERSDGYWLYVEQAVASSLDRPYRQRVYHLSRRDKDTFESAVYELDDPMKYAGEWKKSYPLDGLTAAALVKREGASILLKRTAPGKFEGSTEGKKCKSTFRGAAYATSHVTITAESIYSWDRGFNEEDVQVWGAVKGGYLFDRIEHEGGSFDETGSTTLRGGLKPGAHAVGFMLKETKDRSRTVFTGDGAAGHSGTGIRPVRVYIWYPAAKARGKPLRVRDYARMAADDFGSIGKDPAAERGDMPLPVQLERGLDGKALDLLLETPSAAVRDALPHAGPFPLVILGQGLYYESPFTHFLLCEHLASCGYVVATCPLAGQHTRLVNLSVTDLEAQVRDMEFTLSNALELPFVDQERLGVIGYDLGGMSGIILCMRNPGVDAFLSLDSGILYGHFSELPRVHPHYNEDLFVIPWMHITQERFVRAVGRRGKASSLMSRKTCGDTYLLLVDTSSHGHFTSYAAFGIEKPVRGYWGPVTADGASIHRAVCEYTLSFFNACLKDDDEARAFLRKDPEHPGLSGAIAEIQRKKGEPGPPLQDALVRLLIEKGTAEALPVIRAAMAAHPGRSLIDEAVLNWLGYHFLYWWGRETEAVEVFRLNAALHPESANAHDSLGEALSVTGDIRAAVESYQRSLELNPENQNAVQALERLAGREGGE